MFVMENQVQERPAEKVLKLAMELPASRPSLEAEAARVEMLLDSLQQPVSELGGEMMVELVQVLEGQLDGIYGLLDGDEVVFEESVALLVECDGRLRWLEDRLATLQEEVPLFA